MTERMVRWDKHKFSLSLGILLSCLISLHSHAGTISPRLHSFLNSLDDQEEVSVIVTLTEKADVKTLKDGNRRLLRSQIIKALRSKADMTQRPFKAFLESRKVKKIKSLWLINGLAIRAPAEVIRQLEFFPGVESIRLDATIQAPKVTYETSTVPEWNLSAIQASELWALGYTGQGVVVASMDTGVDVDHPDLRTKWRGGDNSWYDPNGQHATPYDADGHGTQTMGIMIGGNAGGSAIGVAPDAKWIAVKIFNDTGQSTLSTIHQGFEWLLDPDGNPDTDDAPEVVNLSWQLGDVGECSLEFQPDIQALKAAQISVAVSAGNFGPYRSTSISPANCAESFAVGAIDQSISITSFSSRGPSACDGSVYPEVVAPGLDIKTTDLTFGGLFPDSYVIVSGTSFSAPHAAGAMALLFNAFPNLTLSELELALKQSAFDLGLFGPDNDYGYGLVDIKEAYDLLLNPVPDISVYPLSHNFGDIEGGSHSSPQPFTLINKGIRDLVVDDIWITGANASEFTKPNDTCSRQTLPPSAVCSVQIVFSPESVGTRSANLAFLSNDPDTPKVDIPLSGTAVLVTPQAAILESPSGAITTNTPTYRWNAVTYAEDYYLLVNDSTGVKIQQWVTAAGAGCPDGTGICSVTPTTQLAAGAAMWWIQTKNGRGTGPRSVGKGFTVSPPGAATLISPTGTITDNTPTYTWNAVSGATWYRLWVNDSTGNKIQTWYPAVDAGCPAGVGTCSVPPTPAVATGAASWWIQTWSPVGYGPWSPGMNFTVVPPAPATLISPTGTITDPTPMYTWNAVSGSTWYHLWVNDSTGKKINQWYRATDAGCPAGTGTCSVTPINEVVGASQWWVQTYGNAGFGPWSTPLSFTTPIPTIPLTTTLVSPTGTIGDTTPTYTWNAVPNATWYHLWVNDATGNKINQWYPAADAGCPDGTGTCSVTPAKVLATGAASWWIRTYNAAGYGPWSSALPFTVGP
jgi:bacillopeptidase F